MAWIAGFNPGLFTYPKHISFVCHVIKLFSLLAPMCPMFRDIRQLYATVWGSWEFNPKHNVFTGVCLFLEGGIPMQPLPIMYRTSLYSLQLPLPPPPRLTSDLDPLLMTSGGHYWRPVQTCSFRPLPESDICGCPLKHIRLPSG